MKNLKKIIFIDDNFAVIKDTFYLACKMFFDGKYDVDIYLQPEYASEYLNSNPDKVVVIVLDIMFGGDGIYKGGFKRGIDAYKDYKSKYKTIPIIILTQLEKNKDIDEAFIDFIKGKGDIYLEQISTSPEQFVNHIKEILKNGNK